MSSEHEPPRQPSDRPPAGPDPRHRGRLVKVAFARNLAEAELIQGLLREHGIPSTERRTRGFDAPDFLAAGPRDILVPEAAETAAREALNQADPARGNGAPRRALGPPTSPLRLLAWLLAGLAVAALLVYGLDLLVG